MNDDEDDKEIFDRIFEGVDEALNAAMAPFANDERAPSMLVQTLMTIACNIYVSEGGTLEDFLDFAETEFQVSVEEAALETVSNKDDYGSN
jgi:hypothetical protein